MNTLIDSTVETNTMELSCTATVEVQNKAGLVDATLIHYTYKINRYGIEDLIAWWGSEEDGELIEDDKLMSDLLGELESIHFYDIIQEEVDYADDDGRKSDESYEARNEK